MPPITVSTPILDYGRCFLHHPYELPVHLVNESDLPAKYELLSQVINPILLDLSLKLDFLAQSPFKVLSVVSSSHFEIKLLKMPFSTKLHLFLLSFFSFLRPL